jgi:hypothetical protein
MVGILVLNTICLFTSAGWAESIEGPNGHFYILINQTLTFDQARDRASELPDLNPNNPYPIGHLVAIDDAAEQQFLEKQILSEETPSIIAWIGGWYNETQQESLWITDRNIGYNKFALGHPQSNHYGLSITGSDPTRDYKWFGQLPTEILGSFIIEYEPASDVGSAEISVNGKNGTVISHNDSLPGLEDGTDFGTVMVGSSSPVHTFYIRNNGTASLNLTTPASVGCPDFSITPSPPNDVILSGGGFPTDFQVTFSPTTTGTLSCWISIPNDVTDPYTFKIQGIGVTKQLPTLTWLPPTELMYGTILSALQLNATADVSGTFSYSPPVGTLLEAGEQILTVTLTPYDTSQYEVAHQAMLVTVTKRPLIAQIESQTRPYGAENSPFNLTYTGWVKGVETIDIEPLLQTTAEQNSAPGDYPITCQGGEDNNYDIICQAGTLTITPAETTVTLTQSDLMDSGITFDFIVQPLLNVPEVPTGTVTVKEGENLLCEGTLTDGQGQCATTILTDLGEKTLTATYTGDIYFLDSTAQITLQITQVHYDSTPLSGQSIQMGSQLIQTATTAMLTVSATGNLPLEVSLKEITGPDAQSFTLLEPTSSWQIAAGATQVITIQCTPHHEGAHTAILYFTSNDPTYSTPHYPLTCTGLSSLPPLYTSTPEPDSTLNFSRLSIGESSTLDLNIIKQGEAPLTIIRTDIMGDTGFAVVSPDFPFTLSQDITAQTIVLQCTPSILGEQRATLTLTTDDPESPTVEYSLTCQGLTPPTIEDLELSHDHISTDAQPGTFVGHLTPLVSGMDTPRYVYTLLDDSTKTFEIVAGALQLAKELQPTTYSITVRVTEENSQLSLDKSFSITAFSENHAPTDIYLSNRIVSEDSTAGTPIGQFYTADPDVGDIHTYRIKSGGLFTIIGNQLRVAKNVNFDVELAKDYLIEVASTDQGDLTIIKRFLIQVEDVPYKVGGAAFSGEIHPTMGEVDNQLIIDAPEIIRLVGRIKPPIYHIGKPADIIAIYHWTPEAETEPLTIPTVFANQKILAQEMEMTLFQGRLTDLPGVFKVELGYQIAAQTSLKAPIAQLIVRPNQPPTAITLSNDTIARNSPEGTLVGTFSTQDADNAELFTYGLLDNSERHFKIIDNALYTGTWQFTEPYYAITVRCVDIAGDFIDKTFTIKVVESQTAIEDIRLTRTFIPENSPSGTVIGRLFAVGLETVDTYTLLENATGRFKLQNDLLMVANNHPLDFETQSSYQITVAGENAEQALEKTLTIQLDNEPDITVKILEIRDTQSHLLQPTQLTADETIIIHLEIVPDAEHWGQTADLFGVAQVTHAEQTSWQVIKQPTWSDWQGDPISLSTIPAVSLQETIAIDLWQGDLSALADSTLQLYIGYRLENGQMVHAREMLQLKVAP